jgi:Mrp family chromosome partitioning ATPase
MTADILFHAENVLAHILAITSLKSKAGNSSIAAELAALLAHSKRRVLLIDANLPEPSLHKRLGIQNEAGLARMLEEAHRLKIPTTPGGSRVPVISEPKLMEPELFPRVRKSMRAGQARTMEETETYKVKIPDMPNGSHSQPGFSDSGIAFGNYIVQTRIPNLFVLPAGRTSISPASLLSIPEMNQFLAWAAQRGDYIVIDCPALTSAEAHILASLSDQTFLVIDAVKDRIKQVESMKEELLDTGIKLSGYIANKLGRWI